MSVKVSSCLPITLWAEKRKEILKGMWFHYYHIEVFYYYSYLVRIRRKIRNKVSAQDSRKRKKEYLDSMEDRVRQCSEENDELHKRIEQLESQNKTLASQLKRLHQIIVSGGFTTRQNQTSTAMMVLLLSTALFLIPGFKDHQGMFSM